MKHSFGHWNLWSSLNLEHDTITVSNWLEVRASQLVFGHNTFSLDTKAMVQSVFNTFTVAISLVLEIISQCHSRDGAFFYAGPRQSFWVPPVPFEEKGFFKSVSKNFKEFSRFVNQKPWEIFVYSVSRSASEPVTIFTSSVINITLTLSESVESLKDPHDGTTFLQVLSSV